MGWRWTSPSFPIFVVVVVVVCLTSTGPGRTQLELLAMMRCS